MSKRTTAQLKRPGKKPESPAPKRRQAKPKSTRDTVAPRGSKSEARKVKPKIPSKPKIHKVVKRKSIGKSVSKSRTKSVRGPKSKPAIKTATAKAATPVKKRAKQTSGSNGRVTTSPAVEPQSKAGKNAKINAKNAPVTVLRPGAIFLRPASEASRKRALNRAKVAAKNVKPVAPPPEPENHTLPYAPPMPGRPTSERPMKNKAGFGERDLQHFRELLLAKRREILGDVSSMEREALSENKSDLSNLPVHMADQGTDAYEQEFTLGLVENNRALLKDINDAMAKIQNGTYGLCEGTGKPISLPRLEAIPWVRYSLEFAQIREKKQGMFRR